MSAELAHKLGWFHLRGSPGRTAYFRLPAAELKSLKGEWTAQEGSFVAMSSVPGQPPAESHWRVVAWSDYERRGAFFSTGGVSPDQREPVLEGEIAVPPAPGLIGQQFEGVLEARIFYPAYTYDKQAWEERTGTVIIPCRLSVEAANPIRDAVNFLDRKDKERADQQGGWLWALPMMAGALGLVPIAMHGPSGFLSSLGDLVAFLSTRD